MQEMFILLDGISGETQAKGVDKKNIDVLNFNWGIEQQSAMHTGGGGGAGKATVHDLEFTHYYDKASPTLAQFCLNGKHIKSGVLTIRKAVGANPIEYLKIKMEDILITYTGQVGLSTDDVRITEKVRLAFSRLDVTYTEQSQSGTKSGPVNIKWDIKKNAAS